jgi:mono/diheme cytochrome c family protein
MQRSNNNLPCAGWFMSFRRLRILIILFAMCWAAVEWIAPGGSSQTRRKPSSVVKDDSFKRVIAPFIAEHCAGCHDASARSGGLDLTADTSTEDIRTHRDDWEHVLEKVRSGEMPPRGAPRPPAKQIEAFTRWLGALFTRLDREIKPDPGRVTARRLNRAEYNNTIRDLLGVDFKPAEDFPPDDSGYGFDNNGDVLSLSPLLMEKYLKAAERIAAAAIPVFSPVRPTLARFRPDQKDRVKREKNAVELTFDFPFEAEYELQADVQGALSKEPLMVGLKLWLDGREVKSGELDRKSEKPWIFGERTLVTAGKHTLRAEFFADLNDPRQTPEKVDKKSSALGFNALQIKGPYNQRPPAATESSRRIFICGHSYGQHNETCARQVVGELARRAYRRPVTKPEIDGLMRFVQLARDEGDPFEQGVRVALQAMLASPHFLFRIERDQTTTSHRINDFELASRLSYFLWSSMPDERLMQLAGTSRLRQPTVLKAQVRRMLADAKSQGFIENFGGQWLQLRNLDAVKPDPDRFPTFTPELRTAMKQETEMFFSAILHEDRSVLDFIDGRFTYLNETLARHYGIAGVEGKEFRRVTLDGAQRSGVLTQASVLTVSSYPTRTSPVIRGKWILENILNAPPPPPPANVPSLDEKDVGTSASLRERLEQHRSNSVCASCHSKMDPLGFGLENYDAIGQWRTRDGKFPIDCSGKLPSGESFQSPAELKTILMKDRDAFAYGLTEKMLTYALGRGLERFDKPVVQTINKRLAADRYKISRLILEITESLPFQKRRAGS